MCDFKDRFTPRYTNAFFAKIECKYGALYRRVDPILDTQVRLPERSQAIALSMAYPFT